MKQEWVKVSRELVSSYNTDNFCWPKTKVVGITKVFNLV